jgi:hypothetical protein
MHFDSDAVRGNTISTSQEGYLPKSAGSPGFPSWRACSRERAHGHGIPPACETGGTDPEATLDSKNGHWSRFKFWTLTEPLELAPGTGRGWHALPPAGSVFGERSGVNLRTSCQASRANGPGLVRPDSCASPLLAHARRRACHGQVLV